MGKIFGIPFLCLVLPLVAGCNYDHSRMNLVSTPPGKGYAALHESIIVPKCMKCHNGPGAAWGIDLSSHETVMGSNTVVPYKPLVSRFFTSLESGSMPKGGSKISEESLQLIYRWIEKGAPAVDTEEPAPPPPPPPPPPVPKPTYAWLNQYVFQSRCLGCHSITANNPKPAGDVDFSSFKKLMRSLGSKMTPIVPEFPRDSGVYDQVKTQKMPPKDLSKLTDDEVKALYTWIKAGAKEQ